MRRPNWSPAEDKILRRHYAAGTAPGSCLRELPMRTYDSCVQRACKLSLTVKRARVVKAAAESAPELKNITPLSYRQQLARDILAQHERERAAQVKVRLRYGRKSAC